ncbi:MAG: hypothetical protein LBS82_03830 [Spirochaetaceae bacterium]|jgi:hypothetical protein|nr:hypothetical protein [Spirochaetaceae bacterium]
MTWLASVAAAVAALFFLASVSVLNAQAPPPVPQRDPSAAVGAEGASPVADPSVEGSAAGGRGARRFLALGGDLAFLIEDGSLESDPMPVLPTFFASFGFPLASLGGADVFIAPSLGFYSTHYRWSDLRGRPVPAASENREAEVYGVVAGAAAELHVPLSAAFVLKANLGLAADFRAVVLAGGLNDGVDPIDEIKRRNDAAADYFWGGARWLFARFALGFDWRPWNDYGVGLDVSMMAPFHPPEAAAGDTELLGWRFGVGVRFSRLF